MYKKREIRTDETKEERKWYIIYVNTNTFAGLKTAAILYTF